MRDNRQSGHYAQFRIGQKRCRDQYAVGKVMHAVADQYHPARFAGLFRIVTVGMMMSVGFVVVRVAQDGEFFQ